MLLPSPLLPQLPQLLLQLEDLLTLLPHVLLLLPLLPQMLPPLLLLAATAAVAAAQLLLLMLPLLLLQVTTRSWHHGPLWGSGVGTNEICTSIASCGFRLDNRRPGALRFKNMHGRRRSGALRDQTPLWAAAQRCSHTSQPTIAQQDNLI